MYTDSGLGQVWTPDSLTIFDDSSGYFYMILNDKLPILLGSVTRIRTVTYNSGSAEGHTGVVRCLQADTWRIVSAADDKTLKVR